MVIDSAEFELLRKEPLQNRFYSRSQVVIERRVLSHNT